MKKQNFEVRNDKIHTVIEEFKHIDPGRLEKRLNLSWNNWGFGKTPSKTQG